MILKQGKTEEECVPFLPPSNQLTSAASEAEQLSHRISDMHRSIAERQLKARDLGKLLMLF